MPRVFFVTGTSTGFGYELVKVIIAAGDIAVATSRNASKLSFEGATDKNFLAVDLDVTSKSSIKSAFQKAVSTFKKIDVVVNNAGFGLSGPFETLEDDKIRKQMDINFFGLIDVTRAAMEHMRESGGGLIQNVTSIGGQRGVPLFSIYCASKWAVEGFTEAVSQEVKPEWNIKFTCIEPGGFRTEWAGDSMVYGEHNTSTYDHLKAKELMGKRQGTQVGDPKKGAKAMYDLAIMKDPPLRIVLGSDAFNGISGKLETYKENIANNKSISLSTDFPKGQ